jgi:hypothetical protein
MDNPADSLLDRFSAVRECDIDLLLLEEFNCNTDFTNWFVQVVAKQLPSGTLPGLEKVSPTARHSVGHLGNGSGESDIELLFTGEVQGTLATVLFLIENKIDASFTELQPERYKQRCADICQEKGHRAAVCVLVAPALYLNAVEDGRFDAKVSYDAIADCLSRPRAVTAGEANKRQQHRSSLIKHAIEKYRRGGFRINDDFRTTFFDDYYRLAIQRQPHLRQKPARSRSPASRSFFYEVLPRLTKGIDELYLEHSLDRGYVSIYFRGWGRHRDWYLPRVRESVIDQRMAVDAPEDRQFLQVRISGLPHLRFDQPLAEQAELAGEGVDAVAALLAWYQTNRQRLEAWADQCPV